MNLISNQTAIVGIGQTEFSKDSGRTELKMATEAVTAALADAGLAAKEVDGWVTGVMDRTHETEIARAVGAGDVKFFNRTSFGGGGAVGQVLAAAMAIVTGIAEVVVCYRSMNERSQYRFGDPNAPAYVDALWNYHSVAGLNTPAAYIAIAMQRYMYDTGATAEDFATLAVLQRKFAATNPTAYFYGRPITREDYLNSRMVTDPFRLFDCCQESDGAVAFIMTSAARAKSLRQKPVAVAGAAHGAPAGFVCFGSYYLPDIVPRAETKVVSQQLYAQSGLTPKDIDVAIIYDHFAPTVLPTLEAYGFCEYGEAKDFIKNGNIDLGGDLPVNTHGGMTGEGYIHGCNNITEAVRQLRGTAANQVKDARHAIVTGGNFVPTTGILLGSA